MSPNLKTALDYGRLSEPVLVSLAQAHDEGAFREIMTRFNQRLFRIARAVIRDDVDAEDVLQEAYTRAFMNFDRFRGESGLFTWLAAITLNEARGRLRRRRSFADLEEVEAAEQSGAEIVNFPSARLPNPEEEAGRSEMRRILESAIDTLPVDFRTVFIMREIDGSNVEETAAALGLKPETVKTRHFRARKLLREALDAKLSSALHDAYPFLGARCARISESVLTRLKPLFTAGQPGEL